MENLDDTSENSHEDNKIKAKKEKKEVKKLSNGLLLLLGLLGTGIQIPLLMLPAGTWMWIEGWIYLLFFFIYMSANFFHVNMKNPTVLINRMKTKKESAKAHGSESDRWLMPILSLIFIATYLVPAFDERYGWTELNIAFIIMGFVFLGLGLSLIYRVMLENAYASKVLDIREDQGHKLIDTGLYAKVRHPMYTGFTIMFLGIPLSLNSWFGLIPVFLFVVFIYVRIGYEEEMLVDGLEGYEEYRQKVKYKLIPKLL